MTRPSRPGDGPEAARNLGGAAARGRAALSEDTRLARDTVEALLGIVL